MPNHPLILIAFGEYSDISLEKDLLEAELGAEVRYARSIRTPEGRLLAARADAIGFTIEPYPAETLAGLPNCKILARFGTGVDNVDLPAAAALGIWVSNVPDAFVEEVSTHTLALLLACNRRLFPLLSAARQGRWANTFQDIHRLSGQMLGLVGFGRIARATAQKAAGLGLRIAAYDPYVPAEQIAAAGATPLGLEALLGAADYVSLHLPATESSRGIIGAGQLALMKPAAYLINTSRGALIDEAALLAAVRSGQIAGAALDVRAVEPPPEGDALMAEANILITPHLAWCSHEASRELRQRASMEIVRVLRGGRPENPANAPARPRA